MIKEQVVCKNMISKNLYNSIFLFFFIGMSLVLFNTTVIAETNSCFKNIKLEPSLIAFTTKKTVNLVNGTKVLSILK
jgi:hypothetical protein